MCDYRSQLVSRVPLFEDEADMGHTVALHCQYNYREDCLQNAQRQVETHHLRCGLEIVLRCVRKTESSGFGTSPFGLPEEVGVRGRLTSRKVVLRGFLCCWIAGRWFL